MECAKSARKKNAFAELAGPLCFVGALVFSFGKLLSYFFLVVGRETHGLLCSAVSQVDGTCACVNLNGIMITSLHSTRKSLMLYRQTRPSPPFARECQTTARYDMSPQVLVGLF